MYLHLLKTLHLIKEKIAFWRYDFRMFQVYGLMDGTYVPVKRPTLNSQDVFYFFIFCILVHERVFPMYQ